nr:MAG TPA: hypothetical protein [Caudoviricetes sp.]
MLEAAACSSAQKISTISIRALQSPHDDVLHKIWRHMIGSAYSMVMRISLAR